MKIIFSNKDIIKTNFGSGGGGSTPPRPSTCQTGCNGCVGCSSVCGSVCYMNCGRTCSLQNNNTPGHPLVDQQVFRSAITQPGSVNCNIYKE